MNREDIIRMAREAGAYPAANTDRALLLMSESHLERFAQLVAEHCAKICEDNWHECGGQCANVIRYGEQK